VHSVAVPAVDRFVAKDYFEVDTSAKAGVKISYLSDNFKAHFLAKSEQNVPATELKIYRLREASRDVPILVELGDNHETTLAYIWELLKKQPNGEDGVLLQNSYANIFYVSGTDDILWAVSVYWIVDGWRVESESIGSPGRWRVGIRVFAR